MCYRLKMRLPTVVWLAACTALCLADEQTNLWSWSGNAENTNTKQTYAIESNAPSGSAVEDTANYNETSALTVDEVIETILSSNRQGRALEGFDEVYSDPTVQDAIQKGDDTQARNLIKDKLCTLGLMQCDNEESVEGKRPFLAPGEFIYAQPPNHNGPYRGPPQQHGPPGFRPPTKVMYGPPKPMPNNFGPPRKVGYVSQTRPIYSSLQGPGPILSGGPPPDFQGPIYHSKPPGPIYEGSAPPYKFENFNSHHGHEEHHEFSGGLQPLPSKIVVNAAGVEGAGSVNIHHHYHHVEKEGHKTQVVVPVPVPVGNALGAAELASHNSLSSGLDYQSFKQSSSLGGGGFASSGLASGGLASGSLGSGGFSSVSGYESGAGGYAQNAGGYGSGGYGSGGYASGGVKPIFEGGSNYDNHAAANTGPALFGGQSSQGLGGSIDSYGQSAGLYSGNGGSSGSFHSSNPDYYKKALNGGSNFNSINSQFSNGYGGQYGANYNGASNNYQGQEAARQDNFDCVCVPFEQCPARDVFGRKGDLILPLDPRNLGSDIEAVSDDEKTNSTVPVTRVVKEAKEDDKEEEAKEEEPKKESETATETKKVSKRDVSDKKSDEIPKADGEGVSSIQRSYSFRSLTIYVIHITQTKHSRH